MKMPYKFETIGYKVPKNKDRRRKLNDYEKQQIKELYGKIPQRKLARAFGVSRRLIQFYGDPEKHERNKVLRAIRGGSMVYYSKDKQRGYMKRYRDYKKKIYNEDGENEYLP